MLRRQKWQQKASWIVTRLLVDLCGTVPRTLMLMETKTGLSSSTLYNSCIQRLSGISLIGNLDQYDIQSSDPPQAPVDQLLGPLEVSHKAHPHAIIYANIPGRPIHPQNTSGQSCATRTRDHTSYRSSLESHETYLAFLPRFR